MNNFNRIDKFFSKNIATPYMKKLKFPFSI